MLADIVTVQKDAKHLVLLTQQSFRIKVGQK